MSWGNEDVIKYYIINNFVIWGGLKTDEPQYGDVLLKILLNAGKSPNLGFAYDLFFFLISIIYVKIAMTLPPEPRIPSGKARRKSAGVRSLSTTEASQRLDAGDLTYAYLVGLFEGDGYFSISKNGKYLTYVLGIELSIRDVQLIYKIKSFLGVGVVSFRNRGNIEMVTLRIKNKDHLKKFIIPIFDKYPMLSNKQYDYLRFRNALLSGIKYSSELPEYSITKESLNTVESIINTSYFPAWLVGFIEAEGCFSVYKQKGDYFECSFDISQTGGEIIIYAIRKYLSFTPTIYLDKTNCYKLKVTSVRSIENAIKFLDKAPIKLLGYKKLQYLLWLKQLRTIPRYYKNINIPSKY